MCVVSGVSGSEAEVRYIQRESSVERGESGTEILSGSEAGEVR